MPRFALAPVTLCVVAALAVMSGRSAHGDVLPTAPQVVGGSASISQSGAQQTINQHTDKAIINWGSFSIGQGAGVNFVQPSSSSVVLNRVVGNDPSSIYGNLSANGQVFLVNPNGVFFGVGSRIDTGGLVATTMSIADTDFMRGYYSFSRSGSGSVENAGVITIRDGGYALLAADSVRNTATGQIVAPRGSVMLASADRVTIDTKPDGLIGFSVEGQALREVARVENAGFIAADGGQIAMSARGARELAGMVVNNTGVLRASSIEERDGAVILSASSGVTQSSGQIDVSGTRGGLIEVTNTTGTAAVAGDALARGTSGAGGRVVVAGVQTGLMNGANVDASGATGGTVIVGGEYRGGQVESRSGERIVSDYTYVARETNIRADGTQGQGGTAVVWANQSTRFDGNISATGAGTGRGGDAEVSGKEHLAFNGNVDLRSTSGVAGTLLLDPRSITITNSDGTGDNPGPEFDPGTLDAGYTGGTIAEATAGTNTDSTISRGKLESIAGNSNIRLEATERITLGDLGGDTLNLKQGSGNSVTFVTSADNSTINFANRSDTIRTDGGSITLHAGGANSTIDVGHLRSGASDMYLTASGSIRTGNLDTNGTVSYYGSAAVSQLAGTRISANTVHIDSASSVDLQLANRVANFNALSTSGASAIRFRSADDLTVNGTGVSLSGAGNRTIDIRSDNKLTVSSAVAATGTGINSVFLRGGGDTATTASVSASSAGNNFVTIESGSRLTIGGAVSATSSGGTADVALRSSGQQDINSAVSASASGASTVLASGNGRLNVNNGVTASSTGGAATVTLRSSNGQVDVKSAVAATSSAARGAVIMSANNDLNITANITATGTGGVGAEAARVESNAGGTTRQTSGQIKAMDNGAKITNPAQATHFAVVDLKGFSVDVRNVLAESTNGRAQVFLSGPHDVTVASGGTVHAIAASQPGVSITANSDDSGGGDVKASGSTIKTTLTDQRVVTETKTTTTNGVTTTTTSTSYKDINKTVADVGGVGIVGNSITVGNVSTNKGAGVNNSLYGISIGASDNVTIRDVVTTDSEAGVSLSTTGTNSTVKTEGSGIIRADALAVTGDRDKGIFSLKTNIASLTVLGGKGVDIDNTERVGRLTISALGRISDATEAKDPQTGEVTNVPATNKPVGGVRIQSSDIYLMSLDNRSSNNYNYSGGGTTDQQGLHFIADKLDFVPGTIFTKADTYAQFRPYTSGKDIQVAYVAPSDAQGRTIYTAGIVGLLNQLHPDSTVTIGGDGYAGNIYIGTPGDTMAQQIKLGRMELHFETTGRVYNNLSGGQNLPGSWSESGGGPWQANVPLCNMLVNACLQAMTTSRVYVKDSYQQVTPDGSTRNVYFQGSGDGTGGTVPPANSGETGNGGSGGGNGNNSGGGGGTSTGNGSEPGGPNEQPNNPPGGGNTENTDPGGTGTTSNTNNPGQTSQNPGGTPGDGGDPGEPGSTGTNNPGDNIPPGDPIAGGGDLSGDPDPGNPNNPGPDVTGPDPNPNPNTPDPEFSDPTDPTNPNNPDTGNPPGTTPGGEFSGDPTNPPDPTDPGTTPGGDIDTGTPGNNPPGNTPGTTPGGEFSGDPTTPGDNPNTPDTETGGPGPGSNPPGNDPTPSGPTDGGEFSGDPTNPVNPNTPGDGTTPGTNTGNNNPGGDTTIGDGTPPPGGNPTDGGEFSGDPGTNTGNNPGTDPGTNTGNNNGTPGNTGNTGNTGDGTDNTAGNNNNPGNNNPGNTGGDTTDTSGNGNTGNTNTGSNTGNNNTGSQGDDTAQNGGFTGGANGGSNNPSSSGGDNSGGSVGDGTFSDGSPSTGGDGTQTAGNNGSSGNQGGTSNTGNNNTGSNQGSGSGNNNDGSGSGNDNVASSGDGSSSGNNSSGTGSQSGSSSGSSSGDGNSGEQDLFAGGGSGGATGAAGNDSQDSGATGGASSSGSGSGSQGTSTTAQQGTSSQQGTSQGTASRAETRAEYPPCEDEGQSVKNISKAGQPNFGLIRQQASGLRLRPAEGDLSQQRADCARKVSQN